MTNQQIKLSKLCRVPKTISQLQIKLHCENLDQVEKLLDNSLSVYIERNAKEKNRAETVLSLNSLGFDYLQTRRRDFIIWLIPVLLSCIALILSFISLAFSFKPIEVRVLSMPQQ